MANVSIQLGTNASTLGLTVAVQPRVAEAEVTTTESALEEALASGVSFKYTNTLLGILRSNVITESNYAAAVKALLYTASVFETGNILKPYLEDDTLFIEFRSRRRLLDLDEIVRPYYGNIMYALRELQTAGVHPAICDWVLERFMSNNGLYRVSAAACICVIAALLDLGIVVTV